jgi:hypothetical protein
MAVSLKESNCFFFSYQLHAISIKALLVDDVQRVEGLERGRELALAAPDPAVGGLHHEQDQVGARPEEEFRTQFRDRVLLKKKTQTNRFLLPSISASTRVTR